MTTWEDVLVLELLKAVDDVVTAFEEPSTREEDLAYSVESLRIAGSVVRSILEYHFKR